MLSVPALGRQRQVDPYDFETNPDYMESSRPDREGYVVRPCLKNNFKK